MATIRELRTQFTATVSGWKASVREIRKEIAQIGPETDKAMGKANKSYDELLKSSQKLEKALKDSENPKAFEDLNKVIKKSQDELKETGDISEATMKELQDAIKDSEQSLASLGDEGKEALNEIEKAISNANTDFDNLGKNGKEEVDGIGKSADDLKKDLQDVGEEAEQAENKLSALGSKLGGIISGVAGGIGLAGAFNMALDEAALDTSIEISMNVAPESLESVKQSVRDVTSVIDDQGAAIEGVRRQWTLNADESDEVNAKIVEGAAAITRSYQGIDFTELIQEVNEIANELNTTNEDALGLTNALLKIGFPPEQLDIIAEYGKQLSDAGYDAAEIQAIFQAGVETGTWNIDNLLDGLKEGRILLAEFGTEVDDATAEMLEGTKISAKQLQNWGKAIAKGGEDGKEAMQEVAEALNNVEDETKKNELGVKLFGTMYEDQGQNIIDTLLNAEDATIDLRENQEELNESVSKLEQDPAIELRDAMNELKEAAAPVLGYLADIISEFAVWVRENPRITASIAGVASGVGILGGGLSLISPLINGIVGGIKGSGGLAKTLLSLVGRAGPVGLVITGIAGMSAAVNYLKDDTKNLYDATFEKVRQMKEEIETTDELIARFEDLQSQNRLTTDEMLEYMDVIDKLASTSSPDIVEALKDRQAELLDKSTLTNDQMRDFLELNDDIIEKAPSAATAISEQGNAYAETADAARRLNDEERERMMMEAEAQLLEGLRDERDLLAQQLELQREKNEALSDHQNAHDQYIDALTKVNELAGQRSDLEAELQVLYDQGYTIESERVQLLAKEIADLDDKQLKAEKALETAEENRNTHQETLDIKEEELNKVNEELLRIDDLKYEYEALWMAHLDINTEKGQGIKAIDEEIQKQKELLSQMEKNTDEALKNTVEYRNAKREIENQITRLEEAKGELEQINELAAETAYEKDIKLNVNPSIARINREIAETIYKRVRVGVDARYSQRLAYADGTPRGGHPGGLAILGDGKGTNAGPELFQTPDGTLGLSPDTDTLFDLPKGSIVLSARKTREFFKNLLSNAMDTIPKYAEGIGNFINSFNPNQLLWATDGWADSILANEFNKRSNNLFSYDSGVDVFDNPDRETIALLNRIAEAVENGQDLRVVMNDREVGYMVEKYVTEQQERNNRNRQQFRG